MSARDNYQPSLVALEQAINNFDQVAVENNDPFARQQYLALVEIVKTIKTHIVKGEAADIEGFDPKDIGC
ncbi:hypothetical protein N9N32_00280 [Alphaproteobacteria bacterium]|nr:hypothetical protein [Alphaproteobacteria bacterium]